VNWISPVKIRTTLIGGEKKMLVWNDLEADEKLKIYDKGVNVTSQQGVYKLLVSYRSGDMWSPQIEQVGTSGRQNARGRQQFLGQARRARLPFLTRGPSHFFPPPNPF
jgi:hypothetical protein